MRSSVLATVSAADATLTGTETAFDDTTLTGAETVFADATLTGTETAFPGATLTGAETAFVDATLTGPVPNVLIVTVSTGLTTGFVAFPVSC